ncbi:MAG: NUDIX hydrolase [Actinomycetaceae bacterium]|nr:NUDIX hydrolase [Actinomycetaceae bacterium]
MISDRPESKPVHLHERVWNGAVFDMDQDTVEVTPGNLVIRHYVAHTGAVAIVAMREGDQGPEVALVDQYRHPVQAVLWEIPAGLLDVEGESPLEAAKRELWEEADLQADRWDVLVDYFTSPGGTTEGLRIFLARDIREVPAEQRYERDDEEAAMTLRWVPLSQAVEAIHAGRLHNPSAVVGILAADSARRQNWEPLRDANAPWMRSPFNRTLR